MIATNLVRRATAAILFTLLSSSLLAQSLTVPISASAGSTIDVSYDNPALAGKTVLITVSGGMPPTTQEITIALDSTGRGTASWLVPSGWLSATFNAPSCEAKTMTVD
jgi:hypothetical protein